MLMRCKKSNANYGKENLMLFQQQTKLKLYISPAGIGTKRYYFE